ncbi:MAG: c-type cytochrome [Deltaproteobacteria bacterium]|nr:c-type cytochrome [Deltaproteobacteria bacterium]MBZ0220265.1 nitrite reductase [Deltaproteobacteria bacterium]
MRLALTVIIAIFVSPGSGALAGGEPLYLKHCASCHHPERHGLTGPPLIPEYLGSKNETELASIIRDGIKATNMPPFKGVLSDEELLEAARFVKTPAKAPEWGFKEMLSTRVISALEDGSGSVHNRDNLFMVVEAGRNTVHFMDGESFELMGSVKAGAVHGGPKFGPGLEQAFISSRDGWVIKYDLLDLREAGRIRAGISARNLAVSADGKKVAVASLLPAGLVVFDAATLEPIRSLRDAGPISSVYALREGRRFVAAARDRAGLLFIDDNALEVKFMETDTPVTDFFIEPGERYMAATSRGSGKLWVLDLKEERVVKELTLKSGMPHLASAAFWETEGAGFAAFPHIGAPVLSVLRLGDWELLAEMKVKGPGFFARTHENVPHIWVDTGTDTIQLIDKKTLAISGEVVPEPGKKAMHIEFTRDGAFALVSVSEDDGRIAVYDTRSLEPVKSIPFKRPVGKYNASNRRF